MKAIILISSIFYILGLKISNRIDLIKSTSKVEKISIQKISPARNDKSIEFNEGKALSAPQDSVTSGGGQSSGQILEYK